MKFLVAQSGPAGGKWAPANFMHGEYYLPKNFVRGAAPGWYGNTTIICSNYGMPAITYFSRLHNSTDFLAEGDCAVSEQPQQSGPHMWVLVSGG